MPWTPADAPRFTKKATTLVKKTSWAKVANATLLRSGDDAMAVRVANAVIAKRKGKAKHGRYRWI